MPLPRYSLLAILLLIALVVGCAKLWHGPHHVIESYSPTSEHEYTFTRNWKGHKKIQGIWVKRTLDYEGNVTSALLLYYRNDIRVLRPEPRDELDALAYVIAIEGRQFLPEYLRQKILPNPLTDEEQRAFSSVIDRERERLQAAGFQDKLIEGYWSVYWPDEK